MFSCLNPIKLLKKKLFGQVSKLVIQLDRSSLFVTILHHYNNFSTLPLHCKIVNISSIQEW